MTENVTQLTPLMPLADRCSDPEKLSKSCAAGTYLAKEEAEEGPAAQNSTASQEPIKPGEGDKSRTQRRVEGEEGLVEGEREVKGVQGTGRAGRE